MAKSTDKSKRREVIRTLLTAKTLLRTAAPLCGANEKHAASGGIVILQDAVELVLFAALRSKLPKGEDLNQVNFPGLLKGLRKAGVQVPKPGVLDALNRTRINIKHYGRLAEPEDASSYFATATTAIGSIVEQVLGVGPSEVYLHELVDGESKQLLRAASKAIAKGNSNQAAILIRTVMFLEFEVDYAIDKWADYSDDDPDSFSKMFGIFRGSKAPWHVRNRDWIAKNVKQPTDYIQIDESTLRLDLLEMGISIQDFRSVRDHTPPVFKKHDGTTWHVEHRTPLLETASTGSSLMWCLERTTEMVLAKQRHRALRRTLPLEDMVTAITVEVTADSVVRDKAKADASVVRKIQAGEQYRCTAVVDALDGAEERYAHLMHAGPGITDWVMGYVPIGDIKMVAKEGSERFRAAENETESPPSAT